MKKQIFTDTETKEFLAKAFRCSKMTVWRALNYERDTDQARRIRALALQRGGQIVGGYIPDCETSYDNAEKTMTQHFGKRVMIIADRKSGEVSVMIDGKRKGEVYKGLSIAEFMQLQHETEQIARSL